MDVLEPGMKVECIDNSNTPGCRWHPGEMLLVGHIYTVRGLKECPDGKPGVVLVEIKREGGLRYSNGSPVPYDAPYYASRFRPIRRRETSIEIFREIVREVKTGAPREIVDA